VKSPLNNYVGSKGGDGVFQRILNKIPDVEHMVFPFIGSGQIFIRIDHSRVNTIEINDCAGEVVDAWGNHDLPRNVLLSEEDFRSFILRDATPTKIFIYLDPPYLLSTRNNVKYYKHELTDQDHEELIQQIIDTKAMVLLSHPRCPMYERLLAHGFRIEEFTYRTRGATKQDAIWFNYNPEEFTLNTYKYHGKDFTDRQRIKRQSINIYEKLNRLDLHTRDNIIRSTIELFNYK